MAACTKIINIGDKFNRWTVIGESDKRTGGYIWWECECSCDNHTRKLVKGRDLRNGNSKSCGCLMKEVNAERLKNTLKDETGKIYGKLTVLERGENAPQGQAQWICKCSCSDVKLLVKGEDLRNGHTQSCGCLRSKGEAKIAQLLEENNISFEKEKSFNDCLSEAGRKLRFDFYINNKYLLEFDGIQHFKAMGGWSNFNYLKQNQDRDNIKNQWCKKNNIPLIRIPYTKYETLNIDDLKLETSKYIVLS